jgi:hypothetical protein
MKKMPPLCSSRSGRFVSRRVDSFCHGVGFAVSSSLVPVPHSEADRQHRQLRAGPVAPARLSLRCPAIDSNAFVVHAGRLCPAEPPRPRVATPFDGAPLPRPFAAPGGGEVKAHRFAPAQEWTAWNASQETPAQGHSLRFAFSGSCDFFPWAVADPGTSLLFWCFLLTASSYTP